MNKKINILKEVKNVFDIEIDSLKFLRKSIDVNFKLAIELIYNSKGKVIVTGMGKSGIIAQKIAATLTSTGTTSIFLHPAEGMHGDLGIINKKDVVLAIGKSGESTELLEILPVIKKIGAKVISITSNKKSTLARASSVVLFADIKKEACPLNLAPTTSTTCMLLIGDAIAITLMKMKKFKPENFALYHPGGRLGKRLMLKVKDLMRSKNDNPIVKLSDSIKNMLITITEKRMGAVSVIDKNYKLKGIVTDYDIRGTLESGKDLFKLKIKDIMNSKPSFIYTDDSAFFALSIMEDRKKPIQVLPVLDKKTKKVVGMINIHDLIQKGI